MRKLLLFTFLITMIFGLSSCTTTEEPRTVEPTPTARPDMPTVKPYTCRKAEKSSLNAPWKKADTTIVIDAYELNDINWAKMGTDMRVAGVIHRSSIGMRVDKKYKERRAIAVGDGYLWGAYHLGDRSDPVAQADLFLSLVQEGDLMIIDLEDTTSSRFMTIDQAVVFMKHVKAKTGQVPMVYANHSTTKLINSRYANEPVFREARFWYARFKSNVTDFPTGVWSDYFLWQFSSEINCSKDGTCLYNVPGTRFDMDVNVFDGSRELLKEMWHNKCN